MANIIYKLRLIFDNIRLTISSIFVKIFGLKDNSKGRLYFVEINKNFYNVKVKELKIPIKKYAKSRDQSIIINASLFDISTGRPSGQLVIEHQDLSIHDFMAADNGSKLSKNECYPLIIDNNNLFTLSHNRLSKLNRRENLVNYEYALCGWGCLYEESAKVNSFIDDEIVWGNSRKARQIIGVLNNGNYFVLSASNNTYDELYKFLRTKRVKFAYSLDGGRSTTTYVKGVKKSSLPDFYSSRKMIPVIIEFERKLLK